MWVPSGSVEGDAASQYGLPLVYDPQSKKYFVGGSLRFILRPGQRDEGGEQIEVSVDSGDFIPYKEAIEIKDEGKHTLKFRSRNAVNVWSPVQITEVFVDRSAPVTESKVSDKASHRDGNVTYAGPGTTIMLTSQDTLAGVGKIEYSWDGAQFFSYVSPVTLPKAGPQTLHFRAIDKVGNSEEVRKLVLVGDNTPPSTTMKLQGIGKPTVISGKSYLTSSDATAYGLEALDDASQIKTIWVGLDGLAPAPYIRPVYFLKEGPHTLKYFAEDNVGNKEAPKDIAIYTVAAAPQSVAVTLGKVVNTGGVNFATRDFALKIDAKENVAGIDRLEQRIDGETEFSTYIEPIRFKTPGTHTVSYRAVDRVGNVEPARTFSITVQSEPPETQLATAQPITDKEGVLYSPTPNVITLSVGNSPVGVDRMMYSLNGGPMQTYTAPFTIIGDKRENKIVYRSIDKLGIEEMPRAVTYRMVSQTPTVDVFISNGQSPEERLRSEFFERGANPGLAAPATKEPVRAPTNTPPAKKKAPAKKSKKR